MHASDAKTHPHIHHLDTLARREIIDFGEGSLCWRGFGSGPPVILLHGGHGSWRHWVNNIEPLAATHTVWVADMPGYGDSDKPGPDNTMAALVAALQTSLDALVGPQAEIDVVGFSFGGLVAVNLAVQRGHVRRLAVMGPAGHGGRRRPRGELQAWKAALRDPDPAALVTVMRHNLGVHMLHDTRRIDALALAVHTESCLSTRFRSKEISRSGGLHAALDRCPMPILLAWGEHDVTADPQALARELAHGREGRQAHIVEHAGHWVQYEGAATINRLLVEFLAVPAST